MEGNHNSKKFKFCYIMRGIAGSGKTTVAKELARNGGVIFTLDKSLSNKNSSSPLNHYDQTTLVDMHE